MTICYLTQLDHVLHLLCDAHKTIYQRRTGSFPFASMAHTLGTTTHTVLDPNHQ